MEGDQSEEAAGRSQEGWKEHVAEGVAAETAEIASRAFLSHTRLLSTAVRLQTDQVGGSFSGV